MCAALSEGKSAEKARSSAERIGFPLTASDDARGVVLDRAAAFRAAAWRHYTNNFRLTVYVLGFGFLPVLYVFREWDDFRTLLFLLILGAVGDLLLLAKWRRKAPALLSSMPPAGTLIAAGPTALVIGATTLPYEEIRIERVALLGTPNFWWPNWLTDYCIDALDVAAAGRRYHLDATAIGNGQSILQTICARVPLHAFCGSDSAGAGPSRSQPQDG